MRPQTAGQKWFFILGYLFCIVLGVLLFGAQVEPEAAAMVQVFGYGSVGLGLFGLTWFTFTGEFPYSDY